MNASKTVSRQIRARRIACLLAVGACIATAPLTAAQAASEPYAAPYDDASASASLAGYVFASTGGSDFPTEYRNCDEARRLLVRCDLSSAADAQSGRLTQHFSVDASTASPTTFGWTAGRALTSGAFDVAHRHVGRGRLQVAFEWEIVSANAHFAPTSSNNFGSVEAGFNVLLECEQGAECSAFSRTEEWSLFERSFDRAAFDFSVAPGVREITVETSERVDPQRLTIKPGVSCEMWYVVGGSASCSIDAQLRSVAVRRVP